MNDNFPSCINSSLENVAGIFNLNQLIFKWIQQFQVEPKNPSIHLEKRFSYLHQSSWRKQSVSINGIKKKKKKRFL